jgi:hypothetical protein
MSNPNNTTQGGSNYLNKNIAGFVAAQIYMATINTADPAGLTDGNISTLSLDAQGRLRVALTGTAPVATVNVQPSVLATSVAATGRVVAPGVGVAIVTIAAPPAGTYDVQVKCYFDVGAPVAADTNNMEFRVGAGVISALLVAPALQTNVGADFLFRVVLSGAQALSINATGAATAGVGYDAFISATRIA